MTRKRVAPLRRELGLRIRALRISRGLSRKDQARELDLTPDAMARVEQGERKLGATTLKQLADRAGVEISALLAGGEAWDVAFSGVRLVAPSSIGTDVEAVRSADDDGSMPKSDEADPPSSRKVSAERLLEAWRVLDEERAERPPLHPSVLDRWLTRG